MSIRRLLGSVALLGILSLATATAEIQIGPAAGERVPPEQIGPGYIETMAAVEFRDLYEPRPIPKGRRGEHGSWVVPSRRSTSVTHSGEHHIINKWGDTRMGIGFPEPVDLQGVYLAGQSNPEGWARAVQVVGYRDGVQVGASEWFRDLARAPKWMPINLENVDRIEFVAQAAIDGSGWYALDDLTYTRAGDEEVVVVNFDDLGYRANLTGTNYAGLTWEEGTGSLNLGDAVHAPVSPVPAEPLRTADAPVASGTRGTAPTLVRHFPGVRYGDAGSFSFPPDTDGAIGPDHYVITVNRNFSVYDRATGNRIVNTSLGSFLPGSSGDPRILFDQYSQRWIVHVTDFNTKLYLAVSLTDDPTGAWYKTNFTMSAGTDQSCWPDYPTLGVDEDGIYVAAYMVGCGMTIWAIDKAPLIDPNPSLGTITAWRNLGWEYAIQPAHTYGDSVPGEYLLSVGDSDRLVLRRIDGPLTSPTLNTLGYVFTSSFSSPDDAPAPGSADLDTGDVRLMMAVYRDGSLWTAHTIDVNNRAGCRWYEIDPATQNVIQSGTVADSTLHFYYPSIMVNRYGHVVMGFTGSSENDYPSCYYVGRLPSDPAGEMSTPIAYRTGNGSYTRLDSYNRNRWGDYSYTTLDPVGEANFYTIQEFVFSTNTWGTQVAELTYGGDCNSNGIDDAQDIASGYSLDCNTNGVPDECEPQDCNTNGIPDDCDIDSGFSQDCNGNATPDECEGDCNGNGIPDDCDLTSGFSADCNNNGIPDECDTAAGTEPDCNNNSVPDGCEIADATAADCNSNGIPDECDITSGLEADCNTNGIPDACDLDPNQVAVSPQYSPIGTGSPQYFTIVDAAQALSDVTLTFTAYADIRYSSESIDIEINGTPVGTVFVNGYERCREDPPQVDTLVVPSADYNAAVAGGDAVIAMLPTQYVDPAPPTGCDSPTYISVVVEYLGNPSVPDCNTNGIPDSCDIASGYSQDANSNGIPDECTEVCPGDSNCDGFINFRDIDYFVAAQNDNVAAWEALFGGSPPCDFLNNDANGDGFVNFRDIDPFVALQNTTCP